MIGARKLLPKRPVRDSTMPYKYICPECGGDIVSYQNATICETIEDIEPDGYVILGIQLDAIYGDECPSLECYECGKRYTPQDLLDMGDASNHA